MLFNPENAITLARHSITNRCSSRLGGLAPRHTPRPPLAFQWHDGAEFGGFLALSLAQELLVLEVHPCGLDCGYS
jgi:hypothetical protein